MSQSLHVVGPNLRDQSKGSFHVHAVGCRDMQRMARRDPEFAAELRHYPEGQEFSSLVEVAEYVYDNGIMAEDETGADYLHDFHFAPCVTLPQDAPVERTYAASEFDRLLAEGTHPDEDFFRLKAWGDGTTKTVNVTPAQLAAIADILNEEGV